MPPIFEALTGIIRMLLGKEKQKREVELESIDIDIGKKPARIIAIANQKGGVGKTTTAVNIAACLVNKGKRILLIDTDPQGNSTSGVGIDKNKTRYGTYNILIGEVPVNDVIMDTDIDGLKIIPSNIQLSGAEVELVDIPSRETILRDIISDIKYEYDYIIIDCPPAFGLITLNSLTAADSVIIPVQCEYYALEGLGEFLNLIDMIQERLNPPLRIEGILLTMHDPRLSMSKQVINDVRDYFKCKVYDTVIPRSVKFSEASSFGKPLVIYDAESIGTKSYMQLTKELIGNG